MFTYFDSDHLPFIVIFFRKASCQQSEQFPKRFCKKRKKKRLGELCSSQPVQTWPNCGIQHRDSFYTADGSILGGLVKLGITLQVFVIDSVNRSLSKFGISKKNSFLTLYLLLINDKTISSFLHLFRIHVSLHWECLWCISREYSPLVTESAT